MVVRHALEYVRQIILKLQIINRDGNTNVSSVLPVSTGVLRKQLNMEKTLQVEKNIDTPK